MWIYRERDKSTTITNFCVHFYFHFLCSNNVIINVIIYRYMQQGSSLIKFTIIKLYIMMEDDGIDDWSPWLILVLTDGCLYNVYLTKGEVDPPLSDYGFELDLWSTIP